MAKIGVLIETENDAVKETNFGVLTAARGDGNEIVALILEGQADSVKDVLAQYGAHSVVRVNGDGVDLSAGPDLKARALAEAIKEFELNALLGLSSATGRDLMARLAAVLDVAMVSDCIAVDVTDKTVKKSHFSGKTIATLELKSAPLLCSIRPNAIEPQKSPVDAGVQDFAARIEDPGRVKVREIKKDDSGNIDLTEAATIITGGRPIDSADNFKMLRECAKLLDAAVGASRAAVDAGFAPHSMQVGQTGKTVSPNLYIACGLSGSVQHFAGMKTSKVIVAINTDKDAPIFEKCDYGIIGDIFDVVPALTQALKDLKGQ
ncbi:MAG: electron transfer flavoprotein subunit alpha/FixB family protein [Deltaproteobacteria bacterium]|jgi:electron transfer flavoprotein alpha subunit|nr:electron transfer flavoprotein subunit alpha/FixB family protein [Deltaproteobacteria bacterium]